MPRGLPRPPGRPLYCGGSWGWVMSVAAAVGADVHRRRWWILAVLCLSVLLAVVDNTIVNVALPTMSRQLSASTQGLQWIVDAYSLVFAGLLLVGGNLCDRIGRRCVLPGRSGFAGVLPGFEDGEGTDPEELLAAAHAACFSMALSLGLSDAGHPPSSINTTARVHLRVVGGAPATQQIDLKTEADVPGLGQEEFQDHAEQAKASCIISRALLAAVSGSGDAR